ncbi:Peptidase M28 domain-containing protein [Plasmodiophora brassicae]
MPGARQPLLGDSGTARDRRRRQIMVRLLIVLVGVAICALLFVVVVEIFRAEPIDRSDWIDMLLDVPDPDRAQAHMHALTANQSLAGSAGDLPLAMYVANRLRSWRVPDVTVHEYKVLLSYPLHISLDIVEPGTGRSLRSFDLVEPRVDGVPPPTTGPYVAYSGSGKVTAPLVFLNYARRSDFHALRDAGVDLRGRIGIARYGRSFRGLKAMLAEQHGMVGLVLYSDPADDGSLRGKTFPDGAWRPPGAVQGGSAMFISLFSGDPLTPGIAAVPDLDPRRRKFSASSSPVLPRIPIVAIGYGNAGPLLASLRGPRVPNDWRDAMATRIGPGSDLVQLNVQMDRSLQPIYNVVGTFPGAIEPDRRVLLGNHRDAWVYGAVDPHSGTSAFLEMSRAFASLYERGWRPRRTLQLCSWDAEEFGLVGSTEFAEQFADDLRQEAIAYINTDVGVMSTSAFLAQASPSLQPVIEFATKLVRNPHANATIYDQWESFGKDGPRGVVGALGSGSDYTPFLQFLGVASADISFGDRSSRYGVYHSSYDSAIWYGRFGDPDYTYTAALARVWGVIALELVDRAVIPIRIQAYASTLASYIAKLNEGYPGQLPMRVLSECLMKFAQAAKHTDQEADTLDRLTRLSATVRDSKDAHLRHLNDRLAFVEREFTSSIALPGRTETYYRHVVYAPGLYEGYAATTLPGITMALEERNETMLIEQVAIFIERVTRASAMLNMVSPGGGG